MASNENDDPDGRSRWLSAVIYAVGAVFSVVFSAAFLYLIAHTIAELVLPQSAMARLIGLVPPWLPRISRFVIAVPVLLIFFGPVAMIIAIGIHEIEWSALRPWLARLRTWRGLAGEVLIMPFRIALAAFVIAITLYEIGLGALLPKFFRLVFGIL